MKVMSRKLVMRKILFSSICTKAASLSNTKEMQNRAVWCYIEVQKEPDTRPVAMGLHGVANAPLGNRIPAFCHPWNIFTIFNWCYIFVAAKEKSLKFCLSSTLVLVAYLKAQSFLAHTFDCNNIWYEICSQTMYHVIPPGQFCHP